MFRRKKKQKKVEGLYEAEKMQNLGRVDTSEELEEEPDPDTKEEETIDPGLEDLETEKKPKKKKRFLFGRKKKQEEEKSVYDEDMEYSFQASENEEPKQDEESKENSGENPQENSEETPEEISQVNPEDDPNYDPSYMMGEKKKISRKKILIAAGLAFVILAVVITFIFKNLNQGREGKVYVQSVRTITEYGSASGMTNRYTGKVESQASTDINLDSNMSVAKCYVKEGDKVKKGDKLFKYNTDELNLNIDKAQLDIDTAENEIKQLRTEIKEDESSVKSADTSDRIELQTRILQNQAKIKQDELTIKSKKKEIKTLQKTIKNSTKKSPMNGLIKKINASVGSSASDDDEETVSDSGDGSDNSAYMTIIAIGDYRVKATVNESNVSSLTEGDNMIVRSRVDDKQIWKGVIDKIETTENANSENGSDEEMASYDEETSGESASKYFFYIALEDDEGLMMGQHVLVEQDNGQDAHRDGIWLPVAFLHIEKDNYYVWAETRRNRLEKRKVKVGEIDEDLEMYQITDGLEKSDYIAAESSSLEEGMITTRSSAEASTAVGGEEEDVDSDLGLDEEDMGDEDFDEEDYEDTDEDIVEGDSDFVDDSGDFNGIEESDDSGIPEE